MTFFMCDVELLQIVSHVTTHSDLVSKAASPYRAKILLARLFAFKCKLELLNTSSSHTSVHIVNSSSVLCFGIDLKIFKANRLLKRE